jgi:hypothetical protein
MMSQGLFDRCVPPCRRAYFFLSCQEKVAKKKARPLRRPAAPGSLRCSDATGGCGTRACGPQTVLALFPVASCAARQRRGQEINRLELNPICFQHASGFSFPSCSAEQRREAGGIRRALSEGRSPELRSRPASRVAQGSRRSRPRNAGSPFLWLLSFGEAKESTSARQARNPAHPQPLAPLGNIKC